MFHDLHDISLIVPADCTSNINSSFTLSCLQAEFGWKGLMRPLFVLRVNPMLFLLPGEEFERGVLGCRHHTEHEGHWSGCRFNLSVTAWKRSYPNVWTLPRTVVSSSHHQVSSYKCNLNTIRHEMLIWYVCLCRTLQKQKLYFGDRATDDVSWPVDIWITYPHQDFFVFAPVFV